MKRISAIVMVCMLTLGAFMVVLEGEGAPEVTRAPGRTLYVAPENSTYTEIAYALLDALEGDTIYVAPGNYTKGLRISNDGITVIGNHTEGEVIVGWMADVIVGIYANWANVSGITFTDEYGHLGIMSIGYSENISLSDVKIIASSSGEGIYILDAKNLKFKNISVYSIDKQAVRIRDSHNITFEDFEFSCNTSMGGCFELDTTDDIVLDQGTIEVRGSGTAIYNLAGKDLDLYDVDTTFTEKFIMMETGNVSMHNMDIDPADILMDVPDPIQTVKSYFQRNIKMMVEVANGTTEPLQGGEINITHDGISYYSTEHFNGTGLTSNIDGEFEGPFPFLSWKKVWGSENVINGTNMIQAWFEGDHEVEIDAGPIDANITDDIDIILTGVYNQTRRISGQIIYKDGPMMGEFSRNSTVWLYDENGTVHSNMTIQNASGYFWFMDLPIGMNYTVVAIPENEAKGGEDHSGYLRTSGWVNLSYLPIVGSDLDLEFEYYEYIPLEAGPIFGYVKYQDGPSEGLFCEGANVTLLNFTGANVGNTTTDTLGYYEFEEVPFGIGYEVRVTPPLNELGVNLEITGYLFWDGSAFIHNVSTSINATLRYYDHVRPVSAHPKVTIIDDDDKVVEGAQVDVTIEGATYTSTTTMFGIATFEGLDMEIFPNGTEFRVSKEGYDDLEWTQGDPVPVFKETEDEKHVWLIIILVLIVMVIIAFAAYMIFFKKGLDEEIEE